MSIHHYTPEGPTSQEDSDRSEFRYTPTMPTAIVNLAIGLAVGMLVGGVAERSIPSANRTPYDF